MRGYYDNVCELMARRATPRQRATPARQRQRAPRHGPRHAFHAKRGVLRYTPRRRRAAVTPARARHVTSRTTPYTPMRARYLRMSQQMRQNVYHSIRHASAPPCHYAPAPPPPRAYAASARGVRMPRRARHVRSKRK